MEISAVKTWVDANIEPLMRLFGIPHWRIQVFYERLDADGDFGYLMKVSYKPEYERAAISIDCERIEDVEMLEQNFKHELMHIVHSPFERLYKVLFEMLTEEQIRIINPIFKDAEESTVRNMERMHAGHTRA